MASQPNPRNVPCLLQDICCFLHRNMSETMLVSWSVVFPSNLQLNRWWDPSNPSRERNTSNGAEVRRLMVFTWATKKTTFSLTFSLKCQLFKNGILYNGFILIPTSVGSISSLTYTPNNQKVRPWWLKLNSVNQKNHRVVKTFHHVWYKKVRLEFFLSGDIHVTWIIQKIGVFSFKVQEKNQKTTHTFQQKHHHPSLLQRWLCFAFSPSPTKKKKTCPMILVKL